jgi:hypothetical protein
MSEIFGDILLYDLMSNIHLKLYAFADTEEQREQRAFFKSTFAGDFKN